MWVIDQMTPGNPVYNLPLGYRLRGELDVQALEDSFNRIIQRHETWRTTFRQLNEGPIQEIHAECKIQIGITHLEHLPVEEREIRLRALTSEEAVKPFDLRSLPLLRVSLFKLEAQHHVLLVNLHHIIGDGLSLELIFNELDALYRAALSGAVAPVPELTIQYADFVVWQRAELAKDRYSNQVAFWQRQLHGSLPVLELPTDQERPLRQSFNGATIDFSVPKSLVDGLTAVGAREGCTFFVTILAALEVILMRYSNTEEILIGTPVANRPHAEVDRLIGNFVNIVALRCDVSGNPAFVELLRRSRETALNALSNKDVPFEMVVKNLKTQRDPSRNPVFQTLLQVLPKVQARIGDLSVSRFDVETRFAQVDLALHFYEEHDGGYLGQFQYCTDLFAPETIEKLSRSFSQLLNEIVRDPRQNVREIPILTAAERSQLLVEWNQTERDYPLETTIQALFAAQAARTPNSVAVEFEGQQLTYRELDHRANQLANRLRSMGVGSNVLVGISVERSLELVIGLLGILKAGGAYVPIDPEYPDERRAFMMADAAVPVLLTQQKLVAKLPPHAAKVVCLDTDWESVARESEQAPAAGAASLDLAYMIYTSGSTGKPKGALNRQRGIVNRLLWGQECFPLTPADAVLQKTPFSFDISVWEFFWPLIAGARLVVARPGGHQDPAYLVQLIRERGVTVIHFVPPMLRIFLDHPDVAHCTSLRHVICSGEALTHDLQERFFARLPCSLHNLYGPTEAAVEVTHWTCQPEGKSKVVPIGRPVANTRCHILDAQLQPVPIGVHGELYLGGVQVGCGYHHRPELTAEKFIPDPFSRDAGDRLYRTGDLCRYLPDGNIEYLGRMDYQVKIRGFRIELGEIEAVLKQHPAVRDAVVVAREDTPGDRRLVAYLVSAQPWLDPVSVLREHLRVRLPAYMVPASFVFLDSIPLSANGKVDRRALPAPDLERGDRPQPYVAPGTELEQQISAVWKEVLKVEQVGRHDSFFDLGGDSLLGLRIVNRLRETLGGEVSLGAIFDAPTVELLAGSIEKKRGAVGGPAATPGPAGGSDASAPAPIKPVARQVRSVPSLKT